MTDLCLSTVFALYGLLIRPFLITDFNILFIERGRRDILQITVYLDVIFLINFTVSFVVLLLTGIIAKKRIRLGKLIIGAVFATMSLLIFILFPFLFVDWKGVVIIIGISMGTVAIPFWEKHWSFVRTWFLSTTIMVLIGGIMNYLKYICVESALQIVPWILLFAASSTCVWFIVISLRKTLKENDNIYLVQLIHGDKVTIETLYMDTGNLLMDPMFQKPVVVLSENVVNKCMIEDERKVIEQYIKNGRLDYEKLLSCQTQKKVCFHEITYQSVGNSSGKMLCFLVDEIKILGKDSVMRRQPVAIVPNEVFQGNIYQGLLHKGCI